MKLYVRSFAETKKDMHRYLADRADVIIEHLIKIFLYPDVQECNHWKQEVAAVLKKVPKLKNSNEFPSAAFIVDNSWMVWEDQFDRSVEVTKLEMKEQPENIDNDTLYDAVNEYFHWLSKEISKYGSVVSNNIYNEIDFLQNKYFRR